MDIDDILAQVDILEYIQQYCELEEKNGEWWGLSPFKEEKTPSFSVNTEKQKFYDFSSGAGGNVIDFIEKMNNCGFITALNILKKYANITDSSEYSSAQMESAKIARRFQRKEKVQKESKVKVLPADYMEQYEFDRKKLAVWENEGISIESMRKFLVRYDSFSNRIVFPIRNYSGDIINVCGRTLDKEYEQKGLRKYTYFKPLGCLDTLYGFAENKQAIYEKREIILFEGAKSVMLADGWGVKNACAILTSHLNPQQLDFLIKLSVRVVFALDKEIDITEDVNIGKLKRYVGIDWVRDGDNLLRPKMAPVDAGFDTWKKLYERRKPIN